MKRFLTVIIAVIVILSCISLSACSEKQKEVTVMPINGYYDGSVLDIKQEEAYSFCDTATRQPYVDDSAKKTETIELDGKTYSGEYDYSMAVLYNTYVSDVYAMEHGEFFINRDTGEVTSFYWKGIPADGPGITIDEGAEKVSEMAKKYIDTDKYTYTQENTGYFYRYNFRRYVDEIETANSFNVCLSYSGNILTYENFISKQLDTALDAEKDGSLSKLQNKEAEDKVYEKTKDEYKKYYENSEYKVSSDIKHKTIVGMKNGDVGIVYSVETRITKPSLSGDGTYSESGNIANFLVCNK